MWFGARLVEGQVLEVTFEDVGLRFRCYGLVSWMGFRGLVLGLGFRVKLSG